jgi:hypothetical protein
MATTLPIAFVLVVGLSASTDPTVNVLLLKGHNTLDKRAAGILAKSGIRVIERKFSDPLSLEMLRRFHAVMLGDCGGLNVPVFGLHSHMANYYTAKRNVALLHAYVEAGGGLYFQPMMGGFGIATSRSYRPLLGRWGVGVMAGQVRDDAKGVPSGRTKVAPEFSWTENVARHPVAKDVRRVYYPTNMLRWDDAYSTNPLVLSDKAWTAVVRGSKTSTAARGFQYKTWMPEPNGAAPPIVAVRQAGKGRVAVCGVHGFFTLFYPDYNKKDWIGESHTGVIDGIVLDKGDSKVASDMGRLLANTLRWLAEPARAAGMGAYAPDSFAKLRAPAKAAVPRWLVGWSPKPKAKWLKVLIGVRTAYSDGTGAVADYAREARRAGYAILVITETFEHLSKTEWRRLVADCDKATTDDLIVLPGIEIPDAYGNRYLLYGQQRYPEPFMMTADGKAMRWIQNLMLGFSGQTSAVARPGSTPLVHQFYKHYNGIALYTYRGGKLVDRGMPAYMWQAARLSYPLPLAVHEVRSPKAVAKAATTGHQLYVQADTPAGAAWYFRHGHAHFFENAPHFMVTAGPKITAWSTTGNPAAPEGGPTTSQVSVAVESETPLREVRLVTNFGLARRWLVTDGDRKSFKASEALAQPQVQGSFVVATDVKGRTAVSSVAKTGAAAGYRNRCSDRQNWIGFSHLYTGTHLRGYHIGVPTLGTDEGRTFWPHRNGPLRGENLAPLLDYPLVSRQADLVEATIDQRYYRAIWLETVFDAKPPHDTARSRIYTGRVREWTFPGAPARLAEVQIKLRRPVNPSAHIFPQVTRVSGRRKQAHDLRAGEQAGALVALEPGLRVLANGNVGFIPPSDVVGPLSAGHTWRARFLRATKPEKTADMMKALKLLKRNPLKLTRGRLRSLDLVARIDASKHGVVGNVVAPVKLGFTLPVFVTGLNANWQAGLWRPGEPIQPIPVFESVGIARLDVSKPGPFHIGNLITCDAPALRLTITEWTKGAMSVEVHNPTDQPVVATIRSARAVEDRVPIAQEVRILSGKTVRTRASSTGAEE